jgi:uncharacterized repeat protein (TIGR03806 family)
MPVSRYPRLVFIGFIATAFGLGLARRPGGPPVAENPSPAPAPAEAPARAAFDPDARKPWTRSRVVGSPEPPAPYRPARIFPEFQMKQPMYLEREPGTRDDYLLIQHLGSWSGPSKLYRFSEGRAEFLLDIDRLVYSLTYDPDYEENGFIYVFGNESAGRKRANRIARYTVARDGGRGIVPGSELVLIEWPSGGHDGGGLAFGNDGMLYISSGDGSGDSDDDNTGQTLDDLNGGVLRIDVRGAKPGKLYKVPEDNPFCQTPKARPEVWAFGLRNPWRLAYDGKLDQVWVGMNGQDLWESIYLIQKGANYGWPIQEGSQPFHTERPRGPGPLVPSTVDHPHSAFRSLTGGVVYRGDELPELDGTYIYGDYSTGEIWGARHDGTRLTFSEQLARTTLQITAFANGQRGELIVVDHGGGLYKLERTPKDDSRGAFPTRLSETGIFTSAASHAVDPGLIPYEVNAPQWADGAQQGRWIGLPGDAKIEFSGHWGWNLPEGSVLVKTLSVEMEAGNPASRRRIETQLLTKQQKEWAAYSYAWSEDQSDAMLVAAEGMDRPLAIRDTAAPGGVREQTWRFASRNECMSCHSRAANYVLGLTELQFNRESRYGGRELNQIALLDRLGAFSAPQKRDPAGMQRLPDPSDPAVPAEKRVRAYLHANCAVCHISAGGGNAAINLEWGGPVGRTKLVGVDPLHDKFGLDDAKLVAGGDPDRSVLLYRIRATGGGRMPRVGSNAVDEAAAKAVREWIAGLQGGGGQPEARRTALLALKPDDDAEVDKALASTSMAMAAVDAIEDGTLPGATKSALLRRAAGHPNAAARALLERYLPANQRVKRLGTAFDPALVLGRKGNAERGRQLFFSEAVNCKSCHKVDEVADLVGPSLRGIGSKYPRDLLLEQVVQPSKRMDEKYRSYTLVTKEGEVKSGLLVKRLPREAVLRPAVGEDLRVPEEEIEELKPSATSLMPEGLMKDLTEEQAVDLLEYLCSLKESS